MAVLYAAPRGRARDCQFFRSACGTGGRATSSTPLKLRSGPVRVRILAALLVSAPLLAQQPARDPIADAVAAWVPVLSAPGAEDQAAASLIRGLGASWSVDRFGNLVRRVGSGTPRRVVACGLDFPSYVVSQVTNEGYLRVRPTGTAAHPLWHQFHEAQRITVVTARGRVPG